MVRRRRNGTMLRIAICDDLPDQQAQIKSAAAQYFSAHPDAQPVFSTYGNPLLFLESLDKAGGFDILLLDVCMPGIDGIQVAQEIRRRKEKSEIIFLTTSDEFAVDAFALKAAHYLVKPFTQSQFDEAMDRVMAHFAGDAPRHITFYTEGGVLRTVNVEDILYIESSGHQQIAHLERESCTEMRRSLFRMQEELDKICPGQFSSPCKGYLVNQKAIRTVGPKELHLRTGCTVPLARGAFHEFSDHYFAYLFSEEGNG